MNKAKVIKFPSHCSSSFLARMNKTERCNWRFQVLASLRLFVFFFFFYILTCIIYIAGTEKESEHTWFWSGEDDGGVMFSASPCPLLPFSLLLFLLPLLFLCFLTISPLSQFFFHALLRCLPHVFLCLLSLVPPLCSVLPLAFIARGRKRYFGNSRVHHDGEEHQSRDAPPDWKRFPYHCQRLLPLMPQLLCLRRQWILLQWNGAVWISSEYG